MISIYVGSAYAKPEIELSTTYYPPVGRSDNQDVESFFAELGIPINLDSIENQTHNMIIEFRISSALISYGLKNIDEHQWLQLRACPFIDLTVLVVHPIKVLLAPVALPIECELALVASLDVNVCGLYAERATHETLPALLIAAKTIREDAELDMALQLCSIRRTPVMLFDSPIAVVEYSLPYLASVRSLSIGKLPSVSETNLMIHM